MKYIWEASDIVAGQAYGGKSNEIWIIGYLSWREGSEEFVSVSTIDGMVTGAKNQKDFAKMLTEEGYIPMRLEVTGRSNP